MHNNSIFGNNANNVADRKPKIGKYHVNQSVGKVKDDTTEKNKGNLTLKVMTIHTKEKQKKTLK